MIWAALTRRRRQIGPLAALQACGTRSAAAGRSTTESERCARLRGCMRDWSSASAPASREPTFEKLAGVTGIAAAASRSSCGRTGSSASTAPSIAGTVFADCELSANAAADAAADVPPTTRAAAAERRSGTRAILPGVPRCVRRHRPRPVFLDQPATKARQRGPPAHGRLPPVGYFRDDGPLCELILDEREQRRELDALWHELNFVTAAPMRQYRLHLLRAGRAPASCAAEFDFARSEDKDCHLRGEDEAARRGCTWRRRSKAAPATTP